MLGCWKAWRLGGRNAESPMLIAEREELEGEEAGMPGG